MDAAALTTWKPAPSPPSYAACTATVACQRIRRTPPPSSPPTKPAEEFYDLASDPHALNNLAGHPEVAAEQNALREALANHARHINDLGRVPENELIARGIVEDQRDIYHARSGVLPEALDPEGLYATRYEPDRI